MHVPFVAVEAGVEKPVIVEIRVLWIVVGPAGQQAIGVAVAVDREVGIPAVRHFFAVNHCVGGKHRSEIGSFRGRRIEDVFIDNGSVGTVSFAALYVAVVNAVVVVARVVLGGDKIDAIAAV